MLMWDKDLFEPLSGDMNNDIHKYVSEKQNLSLPPSLCCSKLPLFQPNLRK